MSTPAGHLVVEDPDREVRYAAPNPERVRRPPGRGERVGIYREWVGSTSPHFHTMAEMCLVTDGAGEGMIGGRTHALVPGTLTVAPPNTSHHHSTADGIEKYVCLFDLDMVVPLIHQDTLATRLSAIGRDRAASALLRDRDAERAEERFAELLTEAVNPTVLAGGTMVATLVAQLLVLFLRATEGSAVEIDSRGEVETDNEVYERAVALVHQQFTQPINRALTAQSLGVRPETVSRAFRRRGTTFTEYLANLRLSHAVELLEGTSLSATQVGRSSGYDSYRAFARAFRSRFGSSPAAHRSAPR